MIGADPAEAMAAVLLAERKHDVVLLHRDGPQAAASARRRRCPARTVLARTGALAIRSQLDFHGRARQGSTWSEPTLLWRDGREDELDVEPPRQ